MTDRIDKALFKMSAKERAHILKILEQIKAGCVSMLDVKKLHGLEHVYRVRKGSFRIIFYMRNHEAINIIDIDRRSDTTYNQS